MPEKYGIENLKKVVALGLELGNVIDKVAGGSGLSRWGAVMDLMDEGMALASVDFKLLDDEFKDLSDAEKSELLDFVKQKFDLRDDKLEGAIESGLGLALKLSAVVKEAIALAKSLKSDPA